MKKSKTNFLPLIVSAVIIISFIILKFNQIGQPKIETTTAPLDQSITNTENLVKDYLNNHITELAPEPETLGGTFFVTNTTFLDNNRVLIEYEDGHTSYTARASYKITPEKPLSITEFKLIKINEELINSIKSKVKNDDLIIVAIKNNLAKKYNKKFSDIKLTIDYKDKNHLRGLFNIEPKSKNFKMFLATTINGEFKIVFDGFDSNENFDCKNLKQYNFPKTILPECLE